MMSDEPAKNPEIKIVSKPEAIPVYNCVVFIKNAGASFESRIANLTASDSPTTFLANSQREAIQKAVTEFKRVATDCQARGVALPLTEPGTPEASEVSMLVAVHL